jgi:hypothetical protein
MSQLSKVIDIASMLSRAELETLKTFVEQRLASGNGGGKPREPRGPRKKRTKRTPPPKKERSPEETKFRDLQALVSKARKPDRKGDTPKSVDPELLQAFQVAKESWFRFRASRNEEIKTDTAATVVSTSSSS